MQREHWEFETYRHHRRGDGPGRRPGDTTTIADTVTAAAEDLEAVATATDEHTSVIEEVVADKGYHSNQVLVDLAALDAHGHGGRRGVRQSPPHPPRTGPSPCALTIRGRSPAQTGGNASSLSAHVRRCSISA